MTIKSALAASVFVLTGWISTLMATTLFVDQAPAYLVPFPPEGFLDTLPSNTSMIDVSAFSITLSSEDEGFALELYRNGAWMVLPAKLTGCAPQPTQQRL
ncbi:MAG: hypothetical protein AAF367_05515 [Pseudomonadota bacterium]